MRADDARKMTNNSIAMNYIMQATSQGKLEVSIPKEYVNIPYLESLGYRIEGGYHQLCDNYTVSWKKHWRD